MLSLNKKQAWQAVWKVQESVKFPSRKGFELHEYWILHVHNICVLQVIDTYIYLLRDMHEGSPLHDPNSGYLNTLQRLHDESLVTLETHDEIAWRISRSRSSEQKVEPTAETAQEQESDVPKNRKQKRRLKKQGLDPKRINEFEESLKEIQKNLTEGKIGSSKNAS